MITRGWILIASIIFGVISFTLGILTLFAGDGIGAGILFGTSVLTIVPPYILLSDAIRNGDRIRWWRG